VPDQLVVELGELAAWEIHIGRPVTAVKLVCPVSRSSYALVLVGGCVYC